MLDDTPLLDLLQRHVAPHVRWHRQRLCFLAALLPALIKLGTVNFAKLSVALGAKPASNYRRIQRFFAEAKLPRKPSRPLCSICCLRTGSLLYAFRSLMSG